MKKVIIILSLGILLTSCNGTTISQDTEMLQKKYKNGIIYPVGKFNRYIVVDSINVLDIRLKNDGTISSTIKIK